MHRLLQTRQATTHTRMTSTHGIMNVAHSRRSVISAAGSTPSGKASISIVWSHLWPLQGSTCRRSTITSSKRILHVNCKRIARGSAAIRMVATLASTSRCVAHNRAFALAHSLIVDSGGENLKSHQRLHGLSLRQARSRRESYGSLTATRENSSMLDHSSRGEWIDRPPPGGRRSAAPSVACEGETISIASRARSSRLLPIFI